jgi:hypothetical protein
LILISYPNPLGFDSRVETGATKASPSVEEPNREIPTLRDSKNLQAVVPMDRDCKFWV